MKIKTTRTYRVGVRAKVARCYVDRRQTGLGVFASDREVGRAGHEPRRQDDALREVEHAEQLGLPPVAHPQDGAPVYLRQAAHNGMKRRCEN